MPPPPRFPCAVKKRVKDNALTLFLEYGPYRRSPIQPITSGHSVWKN